MRVSSFGVALVLMGAAGQLSSLAGAQDSPDSPPPGGEVEKAGPAGYGSFKLPEGAKLLGEVNVNEVRQLPEIGNSKGSAIERVVGVSAWDRLYQAKGSYKKAVSFFDNQLKQQGIEPEARVTTPISTAWAVRLPEGGQTHLIVRNTQPVSFEIIQAQGGATGGSLRQPTGGSDEDAQQPQDQKLPQQHHQEPQQQQQPAK